MQWMARVAVAMVLASSMAAAALAEEVTLEGTLACAKCTLAQAEFKECQNVLLVDGDGEQKVTYYIENNETGKAFGEVCMATPTARVTGTVTEKDGKKWLAPSKIEKTEAHS